jgi:hypothetical protein
MGLPEDADGREVKGKKGRRYEERRKYNKESH